MIYILMLVIFVLGYLAIALEHPLKIDKAASALIIGALGWALYAFSGVDFHHWRTPFSSCCRYSRNFILPTRSFDYR